MRIVGIGGSVRPGSRTEDLVGAVLRAAGEEGTHQTQLFGGADLSVLPVYDHGAPRTRAAAAFVDGIRGADAVVIGSPAYHGSVSGLVKNAIDHLEALRDDTRPYMEGRAVGLVTTAHSWPAAVSALTALRQITHALRGWPTPLGIAVNVATTEGTQPFSGELRGRIGVLARQLHVFASSPMTADAHPAWSATRS